MEKVLERYPDGCSNRLIAQCLGMTEVDVEATYTSIVQKLKDSLGGE